MKLPSDCKKKLEAIKNHLSVFHLMKVDFSDLGDLSEPTCVLWTDNRGDIHDDPVIGIGYNGEELSLLIDDRDHFNSTITLYEDAFADKIDWLEGIYGNLLETLEQHPELKENPVQSKKAEQFYKQAPTFNENGGYSQHVLIQSVVLAEYEMSEKANQKITSLVDIIVNFEKRQNDTPWVIRRRKTELLEKYSL